ncbi:hypothetical protein lerEdw1_010858, partial [Lerista edwardsae]
EHASACARPGPRSLRSGTGRGEGGPGARRVTFAGAGRPRAPPRSCRFRSVAAAVPAPPEMHRAWALLALAWACFLLLSALGLFGSGFLLMRLELTERSACARPPPPAAPRPAAAGPDSCWLPRRRFARAVLVLIDALHLDFARFEPARRAPRPFQNRLPTLRRLAGRHGRLYRFRADPPTTTMQRIKGLTTGCLPTFVDAGSNFASYAVQEDNLLWQLAQNGRRVVFMGDDTWEGLFPRAFARAHFFPSFNVKDLHTVDAGILQHLYRTVDGGEWDLLIAHFLGVDHCGHTYGPDHPEMAKKLSQMDEMLRSLVDHLANDTLLLVAGDHGMTATGDHGGDTEDEVSAALFVYSKVPLFHGPPPEEPETVPQVNLVPTLALLLGVPVPYSSIGEVMADLFAVEGDAATSLLAQLAAYSVNARQVSASGKPGRSAACLAVACGPPCCPEEGASARFAHEASSPQVSRFLHSYSLAAQDVPPEKLRRLQDLCAAAVAEHERLLAQAGPPGLAQLERLRGRFRRFLQEARATCAESWARFHPARMGAGCALLASACLLCHVASTAASGRGLSYRHLLFYPLLWGLVGAALLGLADRLWGWAGRDPLLLSSWGAAASQLGFFWHCWRRRRPGGSRAARACLLPGGAGLRQWLWAGLGPGLPWGVLLLRCGAMLSDSFVVAEARVAPFLLSSLVLLGVLRLQWGGRLEGAPLSSRLLWLLGLVLACARASELFWQCREETPACSSSPVLAPLSSLQDPRAKNAYYVLCMAALVGLVWGVRCWLRHYGNLNSPSALVLFVRWGLPLLALCVGGYWAVASGAEEGLLKRHEWLRLALVAFPRGAFGLGLAGLLLVLWNPVTVFVRDGREPAMAGAPIAPPSSQAELLHVIPQLYRRMQESLRSRLGEARAGGGATVAAYGLGSVYSAALLIALLLLGLLLLTLHSERLSLAFLLLFAEAFALLGLHAGVLALSPQADPFVVPWSALVAWALAAAQFFYATGHQPVFPVIHWSAAFVGLPEGHDTRLLPALLVGANTFASHILFSGEFPPGGRARGPPSLQRLRGVSILGWGGGELLGSHNAVALGLEAHCSDSHVLVFRFSSSEAAACPLLLLWPFVCEVPGSRSRKAELEARDKEEQVMEMRLREAPERFSSALLQIGLKYLLVLGVQILACVLAAAVLRRHLMVWKVFAPKFLFEALGFAVSCVFLLLGVGLVMRVDCAVSQWFKQVILAQAR